MDKFIDEAELLKSRLSSLSNDSNCSEGIMLYISDKNEYEDVILDTRILINEFGNKALIDELDKHPTSPNPTDLLYLLGKLIQTARFRKRGRN